jgi:predicted alpha/beta-hydrolase family hydrolase
MLRDIAIAPESLALPGTLRLPDGAARGLVLFAHGSGSGRLSPRNTYVAEVLRAGGIATLLFDLLTPAEDRDATRRFDIPLLTERLLYVTHWTLTQPAMQGLPLGYFGASTGSASALRAAAQLGAVIRAVVSRGGRPDLAAEALPSVVSPTLFIVGGADTEVLALNEGAYARLTAPKALEIVPGATHLFEEPGALDAVARMATAWFQRYL